ncbi:MAG: hypothetical protein PHO32_07930 [Candidatus Cloacimonetes bacterium]|nr:hypothetical protein [Candidatus Cloacimonadota bacterium]MDD4310293.1 hypothetical protein [Candidatus Cloacimonadota bacterium]
MEKWKGGKVKRDLKIEGFDMGISSGKVERWKGETGFEDRRL